MKTTVILLAVLAFAGCASTPKLSSDQGAATLRLSVSTGATLALNNNPTYSSAVLGIISGIDAAVAGSATITPETIATFVKAVCVKEKVKPTDVAIFINLANSVYNMYVTTYKPTVVVSTNPTVLLYLNAFKDGLNDAVIAVGAANAK